MEIDRKAVREKRLQLPSMQLEDDIICGILLPFLEGTVDTILGYAPVKGEPDLHNFYKTAYRKGKRIAFPLCDTSTRTMTFHVVDKSSDMKKGAYGILEPKAGLKVINPDKNTICIVPGLLFDISGNRLGNGMGYYDRFLKDKSIKTIGVCYSNFIVSSLIAKETDIPVDTVITEAGIL